MRVLIRAIIITLILLSVIPSQAQEASLSWTLADETMPQAINAPSLDDTLVRLELRGTINTAPTVGIQCQNLETGEIGSSTLNPLARSTTADSLLLMVDPASQWMGLPYPVDPWALESKALAIISQRAEHSPYHMTEAQIREEFAWTSAYMLQTARHSYYLPMGDGAMTCFFRVEELNLTSQPLRIEFGRGLPDGVYARDFSIPDISDWPTWIIDAAFVPELPVVDQAVLRQELDELLQLQVARTPDQLAAIRKWDDGSPVSPWIGIALSSVIDAHVNPPRASRVYGLVSVAMYDALVAASRAEKPAGFLPPCQAETTLVPIMPNCAEAGYLSEHAVVAGAASTVLSYLFPDQADGFNSWAEEAAQSQLWAGSSYPSAVALGLEVGRHVGSLVVEWAMLDGSDGVFAGQIPEGPNYWVPDVPEYTGPQEPLVGTWHTWNLLRPDQFRPAPPPEFGTPQHTVALREVYDITQHLSLQQEQIASFWEDKVGTYTPPGHWNVIALQLVQGEGLSTADAARVFAALGTAQADAFIAAWDAKFTYWSIRPVTAIRRTIDSDWMPYVYTPPFPSYISGHATTSGAAAEVLGTLFPDHREQLIAWSEEAAMSRLYGGIHYGFDNNVGLDVGRRVAGEALKKIGLS